MLKDIAQTLLVKLRHLVALIVFGVIIFAGYGVYKFIERKTADYATFELEFHDKTSKVMSKFMLENGEIAKIRRCAKNRYRQSGGMPVVRCVSEYFVYESADGMEFNVTSVSKVIKVAE
ncbi:hypothetical protein U5B43_01710 [Campylobacter sp. 9BO]|uniref:hypothetical protein n=1 Tax=Campylobacter sp. 9BO TaxID=3424759 RepID=UPI003D33291E